MVYYGKREAVLWTRLVEVRVVNTNSPLPGGLLDQDYVRQSFRVRYLTDETRREKLLHLLVDGLVPLRVESPSLLDHRFVPRVDVKLVGHDCWVNSGHVLVGPSENVLVLSESSLYVFSAGRTKP